MHPHLKLAPDAVVTYRAKDSSAAGIEITLDPRADVDQFLLVIDSLRLSEAGEPAPFVMMRLPVQASALDFARIADRARVSGLKGRLGLICPVGHAELSWALLALQSLGILALLGGVGANSRFADLTDHAIDGVVIDEALVARASGDPQAASVSEGIVTIAANLGLKTFASRCTTQTHVDVAVSCGVDYVSRHEGPRQGQPRERRQSAAVASIV